VLGSDNAGVILPLSDDDGGFFAQMKNTFLEFAISDISYFSTLHTKNGTKNDVVNFFAQIVFLRFPNDFSKWTRLNISYVFSPSADVMETGC
jgi:hypothetical protein